jgi:tetratricopeptide (TPR) repeat protein
MKEMGLTNEAEELLRETYYNILSIPEESLGNKAITLSSMASSVALAGYQELAWQFLQIALEMLISNHGLLGGTSIANGISNIAEAFFNLGYLQIATEISHLLIVSSWQHDRIFELIINKMLAESVNPDATLKLSRNIKDPFAKIRTLLAIAEKYYDIGEAENTIKLVDQTLLLVDEFDPYDDEVYEMQDSIMQIAVVLCRCGYMKKAIMVMRKYKVFLNDVSEAFARLASDLEAQNRSELGECFFREALKYVQVEVNRGLISEYEKVGWLGFSKVLTEIGEVEVAKVILEEYTTQVLFLVS